MTGLSFVADTNFLINVHEGSSITEPFLDANVVVSVISEIELLGYHALTQEDKVALHALLDDCLVVGLLPEIKEITIELKQQYKIKTPDAIIAATSLYLRLPLVTSDKAFARLKDVELIII
jgi:predicted nucleic acid-binding protein